MGRRARRKIVLAAVEAVYGTDQNPTGAANAILTQGAEIQLMQGDTVNRDVDRAELGNDTTYHVGPYSIVVFRTEFAGSGAVATAPAWSPLMRMCGWSETITPTTGPVVWNLVSENFESGTLYFYHDGELHRLVGARGTARFVLSPGGLPQIEWTMWGLRVPVTAAALPTTDFSSFQEPLPVNNTNTPTFSLHGFNANMEQLEIDIANQLVYRNVVGEESVQINDRAPVGNVTIEAPAIGAKDYHLAVQNHVKGAMQFIHGPAAGSGDRLTIDAPAVQLLQPAGGDSDGTLTFAANMNFIPNAGDDEIVITQT